MEKLLMCRICLVENVRMSAVANKNLQEMYETLTDVPLVTEDRRPIHACYFCYSKLKQCFRFKTKCLEAEELFTQMLKSCEQKPSLRRANSEYMGGLVTTAIENINILDDGQAVSGVIEVEVPAVSAVTAMPTVTAVRSLCERPYEFIEVKVEHDSDDLDDVPAQQSSSDSEDDVPLLKIKAEVEEVQDEAPRQPAALNKRGAGDGTRAPEAKKSKLDKRRSKLEDSHSAEQMKPEQQGLNMTTFNNEEEPYRPTTPPDILTEARTACDSLLPSISKDRYITTYENFLKWKNKKNAKSFSENVVLAYFNELASKYKPSSLWTTYSMLKTTLKMNNGVDIKLYSNLIAFLKRRSDGFIKKKSKVLSSDDVEKFLRDAPDSQYLATKVALIFGINGACRRQELHNITTNDIENQGNILLIKIRNTENKISRSFVIDGPFYEVVKKYEALRTTKVKNNHFFQNYQKGRCTAQPIGINKFGAMPKEVAKFLGLPDADCYTGHSFRKTSATLLADSIQNKANISAKITQEINLEPQTKKFCPEPRPSTSTEDNFLCTTNDKLQCSSAASQEVSSSPSFTLTQNNDIMNSNNNNQNIIKKTTTTTYHFSNCSFTNCFNN
ncbi:hypothetical protein PYW07_012558 [Mythimna separata]|uniref:ZAD domain-containing protein n=1 Tax=Mythimna separata TaxID=271217 RepID=A0AAD7Y8C8_MYTSE|nr:hypothetical protein PYW07_012558 [Mythimna separata]